MLIVVANLKDRCGQSTCAVNLACELAGVDKLAAGRWEGSHSVLMSMLETNTSHYCSGGLLPVSCSHLPPQDSNMDLWIQEKILALGTEVDYVVVDSPPHLHDATRSFVSVSDLVVVPCSADDLEATAAMMELIRESRFNRSDAGPKCLLVPTRVNAGTQEWKELEASLRQFGEVVAPPIHQSALFGAAFREKRWIGDFAPDSPAHGDVKGVATSVVHAIGQKNASHASLAGTVKL